VSGLLARNNGQAIDVDDLPQGTGEAIISLLDADGDGHINLDDISTKLTPALTAATLGHGETSVAVGDVSNEAADSLIGGIGAGDVDAVGMSVHGATTPHSGGGGGGAGLIIFLLFLFAGIGGGLFWYKKKYKKRAIVESTASSSHPVWNQSGYNAPTLPMEMPRSDAPEQPLSTAVINNAPPRGDEPVVIAQPVPPV